MNKITDTQSNNQSFGKRALYRRGATNYIYFVVKADGQYVTQLYQESVQPYLDQGYEIIPCNEMATYVVIIGITRSPLRSITPARTKLSKKLSKY